MSENFMEAKNQLELEAIAAIIDRTHPLPYSGAGLVTDLYFALKNERLPITIRV